MKFIYQLKKEIAMATRVCFTCVILFSSISVCNSGLSTKSLDVNTNSVNECDSSAAFRQPEGTEVELGVKVSNRNNVEINFRNVSTAPIYAAFSANDDGEVTYMAYSVQVADKYGHFSSRPQESDYVPLLKILPASGELRYQYVEPASGLYRFRMSYLIDEQPFHLLNDPRCLFKFSPETSERIQNAWRDIYSPPFRVSMYKKFN